MSSDPAADVNEQQLQKAIDQYAAEELTLAESAAEAGVAKFTMRLILADRDVDLRIGPESVKEIQAGVEAVRPDD